MNSSTAIGKAQINALTYLLVLLPTFFWGISFISTKIVLKEIPPATISFYRQWIALVPLAVYGILTKASFRIALRDLFLLAASSLFGIVLYSVFENNGLRFTTASSASMIVAAVPVFTLLTEVLFFRHKTNLKAILSLAASILGVYLVISVNGKLDFSSAAFKGNMLVLLAMVSWVLYTVLNKKLGTRYSSFTISFYQTVSSAFLFIPFAAFEFKNWKPVTMPILLNLLFLGIFCSAVSYFMFLYASKQLGNTVASAFLNLLPVVSVLAGFLILDERLQLIQYGGMVIIIASLFVLNKVQGTAASHDSAEIPGTTSSRAAGAGTSSLGTSSLGAEASEADLPH